MKQPAYPLLIIVACLAAHGCGSKQVAADDKRGIVQHNPKFLAYGFYPKAGKVVLIDEDSREGSVADYSANITDSIKLGRNSIVVTLMDSGYVVLDSGPLQQIKKVNAKGNTISSILVKGEFVPVLRIE
ncbi:MAG: hypothetical protein JNJ45_02790 [Chthonomonas sp.]|nr:hypothetical protein [Chthonomonas sp.]